MTGRPWKLLEHWVCVWEDLLMIEEITLQLLLSLSTASSLIPLSEKQSEGSDGHFSLCDFSVKVIDQQFCLRRV